MTPKLSDTKERISPQDVALARELYLIMERLTKWRTYAFNITSDSVAQSGKFQS